MYVSMKRPLLLVCAVFFLFGYGYSAAKQEKTVTLMVYFGAGLKNDGKNQRTV